MNVLRAAVAAIEAGRAAALVTVVGVEGSAPRHGGARMLVYADGAIVGSVGGGTFEHRVIAAAVEAIVQGRPRRFLIHLTRDLGMCCGGQMEAFIEPLPSQERLLIFGAGHVGAAVARLAEPLGFRVCVIDEREELLESAVLPPAVERRCGDPRRLINDLGIDSRTWMLVLTHEHSLDQDLIERLLPLSHAWLGMLGSRTKVTRFLIRLRAAGMDEALFTRLCAPVGLDIGAETPEEIALSIAAELVRVRRGARQLPQPLSSLVLPARGTTGPAVPLAWQGGERRPHSTRPAQGDAQGSTTAQGPEESD